MIQYMHQLTHAQTHTPTATTAKNPFPLLLPQRLTPVPAAAGKNNNNNGTTLSPRYVALALLTANFIGIAFARTLHYQVRTPVILYVCLCRRAHTKQTTHTSTPYPLLSTPPQIRNPNHTPFQIDTTYTHIHKSPLKTTHKQFYSWYFHALPALAFHAIPPLFAPPAPAATKSSTPSWPLLLSALSKTLLPLLPVIGVEYAFNVFPATPLSSLVLQARFYGC